MSINLTTTARVGVIDPVTYTSTGTARVSLRLVTSKRIRDKDSGTWSDGPATWLAATAWRDLAEAIDGSGIEKGVEVLVSGELNERSWTGKDGAEQRRLELTIRAIGPTVTGRQNVNVNRVTRESNDRDFTGDPWATEGDF